MEHSFNEAPFAIGSTARRALPWQDIRCLRTSKLSLKVGQSNKLRSLGLVNIATILHADGRSPKASQAVLYVVHPSPVRLFTHSSSQEMSSLNAQEMHYRCRQYVFCGFLTPKHRQESRFCKVRNSEDQAEPVISGVRSLSAQQFLGSVLESGACRAGRSC